MSKIQIINVDGVNYDVEALEPSIEVSNSILTQTINPNTLYVFTNRTNNLVIALGNEIPDKINEFHFILHIGSSAPTITWPSGIVWYGDNQPTIEANKVCEVSILNNVAVFVITNTPS